MLKYPQSVIRGEASLLLAVVQFQEGKGWKVGGVILLYIVLFSLIGSLGAIFGAGLLLLFPRAHRYLRTPLLAYAVGTLLGAVFFGLLPHVVTSLPPERALSMVLFGIVAFFFLEKILRLPHAHAHFVEHRVEDSTHSEVRSAAPLILIGDAIHNFVDGVLIATSFLISIPLGIVTAFAVVAHEIPQEIGDFVILLESGMRRKQAFWLNLMSALTTLLGALLTYEVQGKIEGYLPYIIAFSASSFLYIATVDLAPILHHQVGFWNSFRQAVGLSAGIATTFLLHQTLG